MTAPKETARHLAGTTATMMLSKALSERKQSSGANLAQTAQAVGISVAALSHMATGRGAIPVERAPMLAEQLEMDLVTFVSAVLRQRHPAAMEILDSKRASPDFSAQEACKALIGRSPSRLTDTQREIIREVAKDHCPEERWLTLSEIPVMKMVRRLRPEGAPAEDISDIEWILNYLNDEVAGPSGQTNNV